MNEKKIIMEMSRDNGVLRDENGVPLTLEELPSDPIAKHAVRYWWSCIDTDTTTDSTWGETDE